jgi:hypothetical protein
MVKQGPIPAFLHSLIEYVAGAALIAAPLLLDYKSGAAKAASIILGVLVLFLVATTTSRLSLINQVPLSMHIVFDYAIAALLIAAPFLFSFSGESTPTAVFIAGGVVWLLLSIGTRYRKEETPARGEPKKRRASQPAAASGALPPAGTGTAGGAAALGRGEAAGRRGEGPDGAEARGGAEATGGGEATGGVEAAGGGERPSRVHPSADAVPDDSIPEFEPPPRRE